MMRLLLLSVLALLVLPLSAQAQQELLWGGAELSMTRSSTNLRWNTAGPGYVPNILSELTWREVRASGGRLEAWLGRGELVGIVTLSSAMITGGKGQDSDYRADNRTDEFLRSVNDTTGDDVTSWSLTAGWSPQWLRYGKWRLQVLGGYGRQEQLLRMQNGVQVISDDPLIPLGPIPGLNSTYSAAWFGPFVGGGLQGWLAEWLHLSVDYRWHLLQYYGWGHWNLRSDMEQPKSFEQTAYGTGKILRLRFSVPAGPVDVVFATEHEYLEALAGDSRFFLSTGQEPVLPFNEVIQRRWTASLGISMNW